MKYKPMFAHSGTPIGHIILMWAMAGTLGDNLFATPAELEAQWDTFQGLLLLLTYSYV